MCGAPGLAPVDSRARKPAVSTLSNSFKKYTLVPHKQKCCASSIKHVPRTRSMLRKGMLMGLVRYHYIKEDVPTDCHIKAVLAFSLYLLKFSSF
jgi:hypothetical protein